MERVECVTDQVRWSQSGGGDGGVDGDLEVVYFEGDRRLITVGVSMLF
jgi:hypothetical protein